MLNDNFVTMEIGKAKHIALVAHDGKKKELVDWCDRNKEILKGHFLCGTGTTAKLISERTGLPVKGYCSGPLGGDQQIGAKIDPEIGTGAGQEETETEGGEATEQQYERLLEKRVEDTLECVEGVGKVKVMITLKSSEEKVVEKDSQREENEITEEDSKGGSRVSEDRSLSHTSIYEQKSDGTQTPYVSKEMVPEIEGMVIAADGGDDPVVVKNLTEAVQALFGVEAHKIKIMKRTNA